MSGSSHRAAAWIYRGLWRVLVDLFRVPREAPTLPSVGAQPARSFQPAEGYLRYLKFIFWVVLGITDIAFTIGYLAAAITLWMNDLWWVALLLLPIALFIIIAPDVVAYLAIHLRYDTTWYVMSDRSLRIRHGIWVIQESTITFENVQNVAVRQGPLQRHYGIADLTIDTAGGGGGTAHGKGGTTNMHRGVIAGIADAPELRDQVMARVRQSRAAGLGDEAVRAAAPAGGSGPGWTAEHLAALREIRAEIALLGG